jgi:hypothetical protein
MRYFVLNKEGEIICNYGGYRTREGAEEGRRSICSPIFNEAIRHTSKMGIRPGGEFASYVHDYIRENSEIVEVSEMTLRRVSGPDITQKL